MQISESQSSFTLRLPQHTRQLTCSIRVRTFSMSFNSAEPAGIWDYSVIVLLYTLWPHPAFWQCVVHAVKLTNKPLAEMGCNTTELIL